VKKRCDVAHLRIRKRHRRHALVRPAVSNHITNEVSLHVVRHKRRAHEVRPTGACRIRTMTKSAGLCELFMSARDSWVWTLGLLWQSRGVRYRNEKNDRYQ
jgi:hypothetical protein